VFDSLAVAAIRDELHDLVGGRVQRVVQTDPLSLGFEVYAGGQRRWLICTADPRRAGAWVVDDKLGQSPAPPSPMLLLCRKYLRGARLVAVAQPPFERVLRLQLQGDDDALSRSLVLIVEAMGRLGNVVLVDEQGLVMEALKRVPASINRVRQILPRRPYVAPPEQAKASPLEADAEFWAPRLIDPKTPAAGVVTGALRGLSPLAARELVYRAAGRVDAPAAAVDPARLTAELERMLAPLAETSRIGSAIWRPSVGLEGERVVAFAPYELTHLARWEAMPSLSAAAERAFGEAAAPTSTDQRQTQLAAEIGAARAREARKLESLERELAGAGEADRLRSAGELLLAYAAQIDPGQSSVELDGQTIALDPDRSPVENAQSYFERYTRLRDAGRQLPAMIATARGRVAQLDEALVHLDLAATPEEVADLRAELAEAGYLGAGRPAGAPGKGKTPARAGPLRLRIGDHTVYLGRTSRQNDQATFDLASPDDLWLHARGVTGAHVILKTDPGKPSEATIRQAAALAAHHSQARASGSVAVDVTERRHVRKIKGGPPGAVTYSGERTIQVRPEPLTGHQGRVAP
jgi:predicted ribosome quality control (RQC) complex YloA/Tae2 family protein